MFVDVELLIALPPAITVPVDAVMDSGIKNTVFVDKGNGVFEPREVETGWRAGDQVEIAKGLMVGEKIVVSGTFLLDSESRMKAAAAGATGHMHEGHSHPAVATVKDAMAVVARGLTTAIDPICGMDVDIQKATAAGRTSVFQGKSYYFCSDDCKVTFDKDPAKFAAKVKLSGQEETTGSRQLAAGRGQPSSDREKLEAPHAGHHHP
jgi:Cu(I)/Ag(I) efflux system membrane fusion protein